MKKAILSIFAFVLGLSMMAQQTIKQGEVIYEETVKLNFSIEGMPEQMRNRMPRERKITKILYFNEEASSYQASKEQSDENVPGGGHGGGFRIMMSQPDDKVYINFNDKLRVEQREFMTRIFLITGELEQGNWKLTGKQKMIKEYPCQEATRITENDTVSAWFTPAIPVSAGPGNHVNLPGLVLEVDITHGNRIISAQNIDLKEIDKDLISQPKKGKKVSQEEFDKIVEEKVKEMGGEVRGGNQAIIRIRR